METIHRLASVDSWDNKGAKVAGSDMEVRDIHDRSKFHVPEFHTSITNRTSHVPSPSHARMGNRSNYIDRRSQRVAPDE